MAGLPLASPRSQTDQQSSWDVTEEGNCISGQLNQLEQLGGIQGCQGAGWCHCEVTVSSQRSWTLEKLVHDRKNANSSRKGGQDNPSGHIPIWHLRSKNQQSPTWFDSSSPSLPSQELSVADWCEQYSPVMEREAN